MYGLLVVLIDRVVDTHDVGFVVAVTVAVAVAVAVVVAVALVVTVVDVVRWVLYY